MNAWILTNFDCSKVKLKNTKSLILKVLKWQLPRDILFIVSCSIVVKVLAFKSLLMFRESVFASVSFVALFTPIDAQVFRHVCRERAFVCQNAAA
jgi:hypothetical protein